ncbi:MAG: succinate dehydrogenase [Proteobacteria bacterium]|jgi:fumarate reductase subunit C|nr:succinate dehydrogenase [Pseudomonadota bacterium]
MSGRLELWLFAAQRLTAMILAPLVLLHLGIMIYAVQDGLSAAEILGRTQGSIFWGGIYGLFILAAAVHGAIGLRVVLREMTTWRGAVPNVIAALFCAAVLLLGIQAVGAIT